METKIKICGLFRSEDIEAVNEAEPDFVGFVFYPKSRRYVSPEKAVELRRKLKPGIKSVGVFVNLPVEQVCDIVCTAQLDIVQLHGDEDSQYITALRDKCSEILEIWKAVRVRDRLDPAAVNKSAAADRFVFDAYVEGYGGFGKSFDFGLLGNIDSEKTILAGGLTFENIESVVTDYAPYAVDLSSGAETDGLKDRDKIIDLVNRVRSCSKMNR